MRWFRSKLPFFAYIFVRFVIKTIYGKSFTSFLFVWFAENVERWSLLCACKMHERERLSISNNWFSFSLLLKNILLYEFFGLWKSITITLLFGHLIFCSRKKKYRETDAIKTAGKRFFSFSTSHKWKWKSVPNENVFEHVQWTKPPCFFSYFKLLKYVQTNWWMCT